MRSWWSRIFGSSTFCWFCQSPRRRIVGAKHWEQLCNVCLEKQKILEEPQCKICGKPNPTNNTICYDCIRIPVSQRVINISCVEYNQWARAVVQQWKYRGDEQLSRPIGLWMSWLIQQKLDWRNIWITYVPCHPHRVYERGFDQAKQLAHIIGTQLGRPVLELLARQTYQDHQSKRSRQERLQALVGAFSYQEHNKTHSPNQLIVLVDDVYTTGSTIRECAKVLRIANFYPIACTFARAKSK